MRLPCLLEFQQRIMQVAQLGQGECCVVACLGHQRPGFRKGLGRLAAPEQRFRSLQLQLQLRGGGQRQGQPVPAKANAAKEQRRDQETVNP
ncbi:hypothetical protein JCM14635_09890 [Megalodesulfovibrio paquesii]